MVHEFQSPFAYDKDVVTRWNNDSIGVYYCGVLTADKRLTVYYIGRAVGDGGIRTRLLQHLNEDKWRDVTHFGYHICDTTQEAMTHEANEIAKYRPKYNVQGA